MVNILEKPIFQTAYVTVDVSRNFGFMMLRDYQPVLLKQKDEYACAGSHAVLAT